jgi:hypothetical protein
MASVGAGTSTKTGSNSVLRRRAPFSATRRRLTLRLTAVPKRGIGAIAPQSAWAMDDQRVDATVAL